MQTILPCLHREFGSQLAKFLGGLGAVRRTSLDLASGQVDNERGHGWIDIRTDRGYGRHILMNMLEHKRDRIIGVKRHFTGKHFPSHDAHGIQVALWGGLIILDHFRSQIGRSAQQHAGGTQRCLAGGLGQAKISDLHMAAIVDQDVFGLDITMHHARTMRRSQAVQRFRDNAQCLADGECALNVHLMAQIDAMHIFHNQKSRPLNSPVS